MKKYQQMKNTVTKNTVLSSALVLAVAGLAVGGCGKPDGHRVQTYVQACAVDPTTTLPTIRTIAYEGVDVHTTVKTYLQAGCPAAAAAYTVAAHTKTDTAGPLDGAAKPTLKLNSIMRSTTFTIHQAGDTFLSLVATFNGGSKCGVTGWAVEVPKDVTGKTCTDDGVFFTAAGATNFAIQRFDGNNLYLFDFHKQNVGVAQNGVSDATRITVEDATPYILQ